MSFKHRKTKEENKQIIQKTCSLRLYPNSEQEKILARYFGTTRYVFNKGLKSKTEAYKKDKTNLSYRDLAKMLTEWRNKISWLEAVACAIEQASLLHLDIAFKNFFRKLKNGDPNPGFPRFKKKHGKQSFEFPAGTKINENRISLPKIGDINFKNYSDYLDDKSLGKTTIVKSPTGKYYAQILVKTGVKLPKKLPASFENTVGIDLGLLNYIVTSNGIKVPNPKFFKELETKKRRLSRWLSRTKKGSSNRGKARSRLARLFEGINNKTNNFLHSVTNELVRDNQTNRFVLETLCIKGMQRNHRLAGSIQQASWYRFQQMLEYKCLWAGKTVVHADPFYPSSKRCSACGSINKSLQLKDREWVCPDCGVSHGDRDFNSGVNLRIWPELAQVENRAGKARINASGEGVLVKALRERGSPLEV